jgi:hypothetical protein
MGPHGLVGKITGNLMGTPIFHGKIYGLTV